MAYWVVKKKIKKYMYILVSTINHFDIFYYSGDLVFSIFDIRSI